MVQRKYIEGVLLKILYNNNHKTIGNEGEDIACSVLIKNGYVILERNYRCRQGEIDIIATDQEYLVFIEVKRRNADRYGEASASVTLSKQRKICSVSDVYRYRKRISEDRPIRYDVVAINDNHIKIIKNAFNYR